MEFQTPDFYPAIPEIFVAAMTVLMLLVISFAKKKDSVAYYLSQFTVLMTVVISLVPRLEIIQDLSAQPVTTKLSIVTATVSTFSGMYVDDMFGDLLKIFACIAVAVTLLYNRAYMRDRRIESAEYYLLVMFALLGIMVMISANSLLTVYLGIELLSLASYALVAIDRDSSRATEAAMKYFVLGALSSGLLLYGISMVYGATQTLLIPEVLMRVAYDQANLTVLLFGIVFVVAGLAFKLGVVPFHMWIPDVYHGAPSSITLMIAAAPKLAAFAITYRVLTIGMFGLADQWQMMLMLLAVASIVLGNLVAISQTNIKRMLAYSAISHMGFMLLGLASGGGTINLNLDPMEQARIVQMAHNAYTASLFYAVTYVLTTLAAFGVLLLLSRTGFEAENIDDLKGLNKRNSWWAAMMSVVMFSMAGIPFFVGFFSKFFILQSVIAVGYWWLAVLAVVMSLIGAFYYLRVVKVIYFDEPVDTAPVVAPWGIRIVLSANVLAVVLLGIFPSTLMVLCSFVITS